MESHITSLPMSARAGTREEGPAHLGDSHALASAGGGGGYACKVTWHSNATQACQRTSQVAQIRRESASKHKALIKLFLDGTPTHPVHAAAAGHTSTRVGTL